MLHNLTRRSYSIMSAQKLSLQTKLSSHNGHTMPQLGFGVYKSERGVCEKSIATALEAGYRYIDGSQLLIHLELNCSCDIQTHRLCPILWYVSPCYAISPSLYFVSSTENEDCEQRYPGDALWLLKSPLFSLPDSGRKGCHKQLGPSIRGVLDHQDFQLQQG